MYHFLLLTFGVLYLNAHSFEYNPLAYQETNDFEYSIPNIKVQDLETNKLDPRYEKVAIDLAYLQVFAVATIGVIALLPQEVSNWTDEDKEVRSAQVLLGKHAENIAKGPVIDNDSLVINYVGHPVAGSYFYIWGRQSGLSWQESAILTTLMSTFYWEYGWESFAEVPSTQDLFVTPILGSILGEGSNYLYNGLMYNGGEIYNSALLGGIARALLNPIGEMNDIFSDAFHSLNIEISLDYAYNQNMDNYQLQNIPENEGTIQSYFNFNFKLKY